MRRLTFAASNVSRGFRNIVQFLVMQCCRLQSFPPRVRHCYRSTANGATVASFGACVPSVDRGRSGLASIRHARRAGPFAGRIIAAAAAAASLRLDRDDR